MRADVPVVSSERWQTVVDLAVSEIELSATLPPSPPPAVLQHIIRRVRENKSCPTVAYREQEIRTGSCEKTTCHLILEDWEVVGGYTFALLSPRPKSETAKVKTNPYTNRSHNPNASHSHNPNPEPFSNVETGTAKRMFTEN